MNDTSDEALYHAVQRWAREIRYKSGWTVETILATGEKLITALKELEPHGMKGRQMLAAEARLSQPMMSKLEAIGRHAATFRSKAVNLPPYVSSLYALTQKPFTQLRKAIEIDLRGMTRSEIARLFTPAPPPGPRRRLLTIAIPTGLADDARRQVIADIRSALERIGEERGVGLSIFPRKSPKENQRLTSINRHSLTF